ncbi:patatin-like phospholipase family protein [Clostridium lundense]|uniref:patatin-like phospholipase family protein n=1 Tax=Clostridium lundense TaxID=319475 RepID=UPI000485652F|nr:patatin-like phospholipase family protein [Clostridium lundense]
MGVKKLADGVFEGGGIKAIGFAGALKIIEEDGYVWRNLAGTSAGAIVASLVAVGYKPLEIKELLDTTDYRKLVDKSKIDIPIITPGLNFIIHNGFYKGDYIRNWIDELLYEKMNVKIKEKRKVKFKDLIIPGEKDILIGNPKYKRKYKLHIIAADITREKMLILPEDIQDYGVDPDELEVSLAVRMSIGIPIFFTPVIIKDIKTKEKFYIVDGGLLSNYPVWLFDVKGEPEWPTIGFKLIDSDEKCKRNKINSIFSLSKALIETMLKSELDMGVIKMNNLRTVEIDTLGVKTTEFKMSRERMMDLYNSGEDCAEKFLRNWNRNYNEYLVFRRNYCEGYNEKLEV